MDTENIIIIEIPAGKTTLLPCACNSLVPNTIHLTEINVFTARFLVTYSFKDYHDCLGQTDSNWMDLHMRRRIPRGALCPFENGMMPCRDQSAFRLGPEQGQVGVQCG